MRHRLSPCAVALAAVLPVCSQAAERIDFNRQIKPILSDNCYACHGPDEKQRQGGDSSDGFRLDTKDGAFADLGGYSAIVPGQPHASVLVQRITSSEPDEVMPPREHRKSLSAAEKQLLTEWVRQGANWSKHWAYLPPQRSASSENSEAIGSWIDSFIEKRLKRENLSPSPEAERRTLARRIHFDLVGLPPTPAEVDRYVNDQSADAWPNLVDRLLDSPHYGERMAIYWLDLVRYADTVGYHGDQNVSVSLYRDYVIDAFNDNMPFDQFTREQLAGDLTEDASQREKIASGYNRLGMMSAEGGVQPKEYLAKYAADRVRTASSVWLGSTLGCAECHDHKFDPFTTRDFYRFAAFFADIKEKGLYSGASRSGKFGPELQIPDEQFAALVAPIDADIATVEKQIKQQKTKELEQRLKSLKSEREKIVDAHTRRTLITVAVEPREMRVLPRGNWMDMSGEVVTPGVPEFLGELSTTGRATRSDLAAWLTSRDNPLTARVFVNRLWKLFFGAGLSKVLDDVGSQGEPPTHPELLDALAVEFMDSGWDVKHMIRLLVSSKTYRQSSFERTELAEIDPYNRLFARQARHRLDAELIRDNALAVSGLLVKTIGGNSVKPYQPAGLYRHLNFPKRQYKHDSGDAQYRRGLYTHWQRQFLHPAMKSFDAPSREECTAERPRSNTPLAALVLLNDPSYVEAARVFAEQAMQQPGEADTDRLRWIMRHALSRDSSADELAVLKSLLRKQRSRFNADPDAAKAIVGIGLRPVDEGLEVQELAAWTSVTRTVLNMHEFITRN